MLTLTCEQVRMVDKIAVEEFAMPSIVLMENAARNASEIIRQTFSKRPKPSAAIFCGPGNNGGDGFAIARHLHNAGWSVNIVLAAPAEKIKGDAKVNFEIIRRMKLPILTGDRIDEVLSRADLVIDALLGTGTSGEPRPPIDHIIQEVNAANKPIAAIDIPSGVDCSSGRIARNTIRADLTVTFVAMKDTFLLPEVQSRLGRVHVADIGVPREIINRVQNPK